MPAILKNVDFTIAYCRLSISIFFVLLQQVQHSAALLIKSETARSKQPTPVIYGEAEFTTFSNVSTACQACIEFFPVKEDGKQFHQQLYKDPDSGGVWARSCRAGQCNFRDPQFDPVGGIIGKGQGPDGKPDGKTCITRDPVQWYEDCDPVIQKSASTLLDATRYCSYHHQMFVPPPDGEVSRFAGKPKAWARIGSHQQCLSTIERQGAALFDGMSVCDSDLPALSGCCETVFKALTCVGEVSSMTPEGIVSKMSPEANQMLQSFSKYCVLYEEFNNSKPEFCAKFPESDVCTSASDCTKCTAKGGIWCHELQSCHCDSKTPPCLAPPITAPKFCPEVAGGLSSQDGRKGGNGNNGKKGSNNGAGDGHGFSSSCAGPSGKCTYKEFANKWKK